MIGIVLRLAWLNLRRDRMALMMTFVLPPLFFSIFAVVFGSIGHDRPSPPRVALVLEDDHEMSRKLATALREEPSLLVYSAELPPDVTSMTIPGEFIGLADEFKYEILVRTSTYNNTAIESCFAVE